MTDFCVRLMQLDDLERVHAIDVLSFSLPWPENSYRFELVENPASLLWVAEACLEDGRSLVVGMVVVWLIVDEAHIATIAVQPEYRRQGVARILLETALRGSYEKGARTATLEVRAGNIAAQELYHDFAFDVVGRRPAYYQDNFEDALLMTLHDLDSEYFEWLVGGEYGA